MDYQQIISDFGYLNIPYDKGLNLIEEIKKLKKEKNAVILGHFYLIPELQDISDFVGDSLGLSQEAKKTDADIIVFLGVHFMAETAKILNPNKKVLIPDLNAGCSLAESANAKDFLEFKKNYPEHIVINYINCKAELKAISDIICTSANAVKIVESLPKEQKIIFGPDKNLGDYINRLTGRNMVLWNGACIVHEKFSLEKIIKLKNENPDAEFIAHPECEQPLLLIADYIGSTTALLNYVSKSKKNKFIVATESGIFHQMKKNEPNKIFIPAPSNDSTCACNDCEFMKLNTMEKLYLCLKYELPELNLSEDIIKKSQIPLNRMLEISEK